MDPGRFRQYKVVDILPKKSWARTLPRAKDVSLNHVALHEKDLGSSQDGA
jgi:hypothetical protein